MQKQISLNVEQKKHIQKLSAKSSTMGLLLYAKYFFLIGAVFVLNYYVHNIFVLIVSILFIGARMHSLYELNHDASHGSLFKSRDLNKNMATIFSNLFFFHHPEAFSYVQWRRVHRLHHSYLFTDKDPNYLQRQMTGETRPFSPKEILIEMLRASYRSVKNFFFGKQDYVYPDGLRFEKNSLSHFSLLFRSFKNDPEMNQERNLRLIFYPLAISGIYASGFLDLFFFLWIVPMYTSYPAILRFMDLTDHYWAETSTNPIDNTNSARTTIWERLFVSNLNRSYHLEHHLFPGVPGARVASLSRFLEAEQIIDTPKSRLVFPGERKLKLQHHMVDVKEVIP